MPEPHTDLTLSMMVGHGILALFGALAHAINAHRKGQSKGLVDFVLLTTMSSFSGIIFALLSISITDSPYATLAAAGAGGFLGVEGLTILAEKIRDVITKKV